MWETASCCQHNYFALFCSDLMWHRLQYAPFGLESLRHIQEMVPLLWPVFQGHSGKLSCKGCHLSYKLGCKSLDKYFNILLSNHHVSTFGFSQSCHSVFQQYGMKSVSATIFSTKSFATSNRPSSNSLQARISWKWKLQMWVVLHESHTHAHCSCFLQAVHNERTYCVRFHSTFPMDLPYLHHGFGHLLNTLIIFTVEYKRRGLPYIHMFICPSTVQTPRLLAKLWLWVSPTQPTMKLHWCFTSQNPGLVHTCTLARTQNP